MVASGTTTTPVVTPTGRSGFGFTEFMVEVTGLSVNLAPGTYWLNVTPVGDGSGRSFNSDTSGTNCVGLPCGNDDNAFTNSTDFGFVFHNTSSGDVGQPDFSMGVNGTIQGGGCERRRQRQLRRQRLHVRPGAGTVRPVHFGITGTLMVLTVWLTR